MLVPVSYSLRSLFVRRSATLLTVLGIAATVAAVAGVLALQSGFSAMQKEYGSEEVGVFLRPGSPNEGLSLFTRNHGLQLMKSVQEVELGTDGQPLASMECYFAVRREKLGGGETNVALRGVQPKTFEIRGDEIRLQSGELFQPGSDEVIVGRRLVDRIQDCHLGDVIQINVTPFRVVGIFESDGPFDSEIWGDLDRMIAALERFGPNRIIAKMQPGFTAYEDLSAQLEEHKEIPSTVTSEAEYYASQFDLVSIALIFLSVMLALIMGIAATFTATNTMLSAVAARTHEIGILLSMGFRPFAIFLAFMLEAVFLGLLGGALGCLLSSLLDGIETGTMGSSFTEVAFSFRVTPTLMGIAVVFSLVLGTLGGAWPAFRASRMRPTEALGRH